MDKRWLAAGVALAGCRQLLGLSDPAAGDGAVALAVHGRHHVHGYRNDAARTPIPEDVAFASSIATVIRAGGTAESLALDAEGQFDLVADQLPYRLVFVDDGGAPVEYQLATRTLDLAVPLGRRYPMQPTPPSTELALAMLGGPPDGMPIVQSTGLWSSVAPSLGGRCVMIAR